MSNMVILAVAARVPLSAQAPADSIAAWTARLASGTLSDRMDAVARLGTESATGLPVATQSALIAETNRVGASLTTGQTLPGAEGAADETVGEYFMSLAVIVAHIPTATAWRTLVPAVGVGSGIAQRVAVLGDQTVPALAAQLDNGYSVSSTLETLALAWFWADSTGAPLSTASRSTILTRILSGVGNPDPSFRAGTVRALRSVGDPSFGGLAHALLQQEQAAGGLWTTVLATEVVPALDAKVQTSSPGQLLAGALRVAALVCSDATRVRQGACNQITNGLETAAQHVAAGRLLPARNVLNAVADRIDRGVGQGAFTADEGALLGGAVRQVIARL